MQPSYPPTCVLAMLELLQTYGRLAGPKLARCLGVGERTVGRHKGASSYCPSLK